MAILIVVNNPSNWPLKTPGVEIVAAKSYISDQRYSEMRGTKVFNLCRSYRYQSMGYYVSLLAAARGHKPLPSITTIQDLKSLSMMRLASEDLDDVIQESLERLSADTFTLSIYFGRNMAKRYDRLALRLFNLFPSPLLRATFARTKATKSAPKSQASTEATETSVGAQGSGEESRWTLQSLSPISSSDIPPEHLEFVIQGAEEYFAGKRRYSAPSMASRYDLAILHNPNEAMPPSTARTLERFIVAARRAGMDAELITKDDYGRIAEFDGLFIRETTAVNHHTYRFARRAAAEGLVVIDDPESIVRCSNKVFLAEMLERQRIPHPRTFIAHRDNIEDIPLYVGFPCVLKSPDSAFSQGVTKCNDPAALEQDVTALIAHSDLIIAQEFLPSSFDWRVGVLARKPLFVCKYHMVPGHWQIVGTDREGRRRYGRVESIPISAAPKRVVNAAVRAANAIGDGGGGGGLYGVDVKQIGNKAYVIEVNDNPNIDWGYEDKVLGTALYDRLMRVFYERIRKAREGKRRR